MKVCTNAYTVTKKDNYFSVMTDSVEIRILFLTDSIRVSGPDLTAISRRNPTAL